MRARTVIVLGVVGVLVGVVLAGGSRDSETGLGLGMGLILLGLAVWHARSWGIGKLAAIALLALSGLMVHLADFGSGEWLWNQEHTGDDLAGGWVVIVSAAVVLAGSAWSLIEGVAAPDRTRAVAESLAFWRKRWWVVAVVVAAVWFAGILTAQFNDSPVYDEVDDEIDDEVDTEVDTGPIPEEWSVVIHLSDDGGSYRDIHMIRTLDAVDEADIEALGGRLVWPDDELELCGVEVMSTADGAVQVGGYFPNTEACEPEMVEAFAAHGLPETGCLLVRVDGVDDEHCAPLALDDHEIEDLEGAGPSAASSRSTS